METKPELHVLVGAQGAGKSTWAREYITSNPDVLYLSSDKMRAEFGTSEADQSVSGVVFARMKQRAEAALLKGQSVLLDATHIRRKTRKDAVELGKRVGAKLIAHVFKIDRDTAVKRVVERAAGGGLNVPVDVIERFISQFEAPDRTEFEQIINH
jgi:predicted kinase